MKPPVKIGLLAAVGMVLIASAIRLLQIGSETYSSPGASLQVGKTETRSNTGSTSSSCSSENSTFNAKQMLLFSDNPHPLCRKIVTQLAQRLQAGPFIEYLEVTDKPFINTNGSAAPDLFLTVNLGQLKQGGLVSSTMKSLVTASLGNTPWQSSHYTRSDDSPPTVSFNWQATIDSEITFTGFRTDRYADAARSIADDLAKSINMQVEELSSKYPPLPALPAEFCGPYQAVNDFDWLNGLSARRTASYCGLLTHNETFWHFQTPTNPVPQLEQIVKKLKSAGWKISDTQFANTQDHRLEAAQDGASLEIFRQRDGRMNFSFEDAKSDHFNFIVHYRKPFTRAEREAALEKLFTGEPNAEALLPFSHSFTGEQRGRFYELIEKSPVTSPNASVQLAEYYLNQKRTNDAIHLLLRTKALAGTIKDAASVESRISDLAKKISPKRELKLVVTPEICRELGFIETTNLTQTIEQTRNLGQPLVLFGTGDRGVRITSFIVGAPQKDNYPWLRLQAEDGMRSSSSSSFPANSKGGWQQTFVEDGQQVGISAVPLPDQSKVRFTVRIRQ